MGIIDYVLIAILFIGIIIGLRKGIAGIFFGFFGFLIIGVALGIIVNLTAPYIVYTDKDTGALSSIGDSVYQPIFGMFPSDGAAGDMLQSPIIVEEDGTLRLQLTINIDGAPVENPTLEQIIQNSVSFIPENVLTPSLPYVTAVIKPFVRNGQTLAQALAERLTIYAIGTVMWFVGSIVLTIIKNIIRRRVYKWLDSHSTASKLDRVAGMAIVSLIIVCIVWSAGLFLKIQEDAGKDWAISANNTISENTLVVNGLNNANPLILLVESGNEVNDPPAE